MEMATITFSKDQAQAFDRVARTLQEAGIDLQTKTIAPAPRRTTRVLAVTGRAGSGKTLLLARLVRTVQDLGVPVLSGDHDRPQSPKRRTLAVLAPTNKAAAVLRGHGVAATTIHRILYTPVYDPEYEQAVAWLAGETQTRPHMNGLSDAAWDQAGRVYARTRSVFGALAAAGVRGADFITGWQRRNTPLDTGFVDESSMLDTTQYDDLKAIFPTLVLFGDPAQLAPVHQTGKMVFDTIPAPARLNLSRIHRQTGDSPILDLAHALFDPGLEFRDFETMIAEASARDPRIAVKARADADLMVHSPLLVWRNATRVRLIHAFRVAHLVEENALLAGEPLICDGIELPPKYRKRRIELERRGLLKGAHVIYRGAGRKPGFSRLHIVGAPEPDLSVASIVKIEHPNAEPTIPVAAHMGAAFLHGAAVTIHKSQGTQWQDVQVFAPDIRAAAYAGRVEAGQPLWKRLAYVAITRTTERLIWVTRPAMAHPQCPLATHTPRAPHARPAHPDQGAGTGGVPVSR